VVRKILGQNGIWEVRHISWIAREWRGYNDGKTHENDCLSQFSGLATLTDDFVVKPSR
jgi:hypothetical protein